MLILQLFHTAASYIFYGMLSTAAIMAILYFLLKEYNRNIVRTIPFFATGIALAAMLTIQSSLLIGAIQAKSTVDSAEIYLTQLTENEYGTISTNTSQAILDRVTEEFPLIGVYVDICDFGGNDISDLPTVMADTLRSYISTFIWHRVWWILGFIVTALAIVLLVPGTGKGGGTGTPSMADDCFGPTTGDTNEWGI